MGYFYINHPCMYIALRPPRAKLFIASCGVSTSGPANLHTLLSLVDPLSNH